MNIDIQRSNERGMTRTTWLTSRHSFSFGNYLNPARMNFGLLRVLNDDVIESGGGFPSHHHDNMEIVTIVLEGALRHKDSTGGEGLLRSGEVQAMSAGRGIYHSEFNASKERLHLLQVWVDTANSDVKPRYEQKAVKRPVFHKVVGKGELRINQDAEFYLGEIDRAIEHEVASGQGAYVFVISGGIEIANQILKEGDAAGITDTKMLAIKPLQESKLLVINVPME